MLLVLVAFPVAWFRLGTAGPRGVLWAEDGAVFLTQAYTDRFGSSLLEPYAGYALPVPRTIAELATWLPVAWHGSAITAAAAFMEAIAAVVVFLVVSAHSQRMLAGVFAAAVVTSVPLGFEVVTSIANIQWYWLGAGILAVLWCPRTVLGQVGQGLVLLLTPLLCPFGAGAAALSVVVMIVVRDSRSALVSLSAVVGSGIQIGIMSTTDRGRPLSTDMSLPDLGVGYVRWVVGDGFLGAARHHLDATPPRVVGGVILGLVLVVLVLSCARRSPTWLVVVLLIWLGSVACFAIPVVLEGSDLLSPVANTRYYVAPAILLTAGAAILCGRSWDRGGWLPRWVQRVLVVVVGAASAYGLATSWQVPQGDPRRDAPSWATVIEEARPGCATQLAIQVPIEPPPFGVVVPCAEVSP